MPSWEICDAPAGVYGLVTVVTCGCVATLAISASIVDFTAGELMSPANTNFTESPFWLGKRPPSNAYALVESEPGVW